MAPPPLRIVMNVIIRLIESARSSPRLGVRVVSLFVPYWKWTLVVLFTIAQIQFLSLLPTLMTARIIDRAIPKRDFNELLGDVGIICFSALMSAAMGMLQFYGKTFVGEGIMRDVRTMLVSRVQRLPISFFLNNRSGEIMNRVSGDADAIERIVTDVLPNVTNQALTAASALALMFVWNWRLALIALCIVPAMIAPMIPAGKNMHRRQKELRMQRDELESLMQQTLSSSGVSLIKAFCREPFERRRYRIAATRLMAAELRFALSGQAFLAAVSAMAAIGPAILWLSGGWLALHRDVTVGTLVAFLSLVLTRIYSPVTTLLGVRLQIASARAVFERIFEYAALAEEPQGSVVRFAASPGEIEFDDVSFTYGADEHILRSASFSIKAGEVVALVGPSGCGKTTIANLLMRYFLPSSGTIRIGGVDVHSMKPAALRARIGIVAQETYLFHDTIEANLRYAKRNASHDELETACARANIHDFIHALPDGYRTTVGDRGHRLSGGQRQRLAIARMLLRDPSVLILDEATSALDASNEAEVQKAIANVMRGRTCIIITHRLSAIADVDRIFYLDSGRIVESGTHAELLSRQGRYFGLINAAATA